MRTVILAAVAAATFASAPAMAETFAGPYVGVEVGLDNFEAKGRDLFAAGDRYDGLSGNGVVGGIYAGYDYPVNGKLFAGVEVNASLSSAKISYDDTVDSAHIKAKESFGASARLGAMLNDNTAVYGRAGWVNTKLKADVNGFSDSDHNNALTLGGGLETRVGANTSLRVEYTYADYNDFVKNNQIRAGVGFRF